MLLHTIPPPLVNAGLLCSDMHLTPQVCPCYPKDTEGFAGELIQLLDTHHAVLDPPLRRSLVKALILLRNRGQVSSASSWADTLTVHASPTRKLVKGTSVTWAALPHQGVVRLMLLFYFPGADVAHAAAPALLPPVPLPGQGAARDAVPSHRRGHQGREPAPAQ